MILSEIAHGFNPHVPEGESPSHIRVHRQVRAYCKSDCSIGLPYSHTIAFMSKALSGFAQRRFHLMLWAGFFCGSTGAVWDISYHFKYLRELYQLPHILNTIGHLIVGLSIILYWRHRTAKDRAGLWMMVAGNAVFIAAIFFDDWWHRTFGIDLTSWSPSHFSLYIGTHLMLLGAAVALLAQVRDKLLSRRFLTIGAVIYCFFFLDSFWYALLFQELGVIAKYFFDAGDFRFLHHDLYLTFLRTDMDVYQGIPGWLYGAWAVFSLTHVFVLAKRLAPHPYVSAICATLYVLMRFSICVIFSFVLYPLSTVPYFIIPVALGFDSLHRWMKGPAWLRELLSVTWIIVGVNLAALANLRFPFHPPMPADTWLWSVPAAIAGYALATVVHRWVFRGRRVAATITYA